MADRRGKKMKKLESGDGWHTCYTSQKKITRKTSLGLEPPGKKEEGKGKKNAVQDN